MRRQLVLTVLVLAVGVTACGTDDSSLSGDQAAVFQAAGEAAAWLEESPGVDGAAADVTPTAAFGPMFAPGDTFHFPAFWGRSRRTSPPQRSRSINIIGDTAYAGWTVIFSGALRVDTTFDGVLNAGTKPLHEIANQNAIFVRDSAATHGWRLAGLTVRRFQDYDPARQTVNITSIVVSRNSDAPDTLTDQYAMLSLASLTSVSVGDTLRVRVHVSNTTGTSLVPPTQMFIHVRHLQPGTDAWARFPMTRENDSTFTAHWVVRRTGRAIIAVDALDSETLTTQSGDDYRSDLWAVPVVVN